MRTGANQANMLRFSTRGIAPARRIDYWHENCPVAEIEPQSDRHFEAEASLVALPGLRVGWCRSQNPACWNRTAKRVMDGDDDFALLMPLDGGMLRSQLGRDIEVRPGEAVGILHAEPSSTRFRERNHHVLLMAPRTALSPLVADIEDASRCLIARDSAPLRLLRGYLATLRENAAAADPTLGRLVRSQIYDLVALAIGTTREGTEIALTRSVPAAQLKAIKDDLALSPSLSLGTLAARRGVTPRYVQLLFAADGTTFTAYALNQRLLKAHRMLTNPLYAYWTIGAIAFEAGFGDLSHFNRNFKRRYGASPSEVRAEASRSAE
jgi:AraC-like DNA-binding protein